VNSNIYVSGNCHATRKIISLCIIKKYRYKYVIYIYYTHIHIYIYIYIYILQPQRACNFVVRSQLILSRQNSRCYNESLSDLTGNATENMSLRGLFWDPRKISKTIVRRQARASVPLFIEITWESLRNFLQNYERLS